jgi:hypothetical protein
MFNVHNTNLEVTPHFIASQHLLFVGGFLLGTFLAAIEKSMCEVFLEHIREEAA